MPIRVTVPAKAPNNPDQEDIVYPFESSGPADVSDGYHTMEELYEHRNRLFIALCKVFRDMCIEQGYTRLGPWRSMHHHDGSHYPGWFIMGFDTGAGQVTYYLPIAMWDDTGFAITKDLAPEWDGHMPADVLYRLMTL